MARVERIDEVVKERHRVHEAVDCGAVIFDQDGERYLQLDTYGTRGRAEPGKISQSLQFGKDGAASLLRLLEKAFPDL